MLVNTLEMVKFRQYFYSEPKKEALDSLFSKIKAEKEDNVSGYYKLVKDKTALNDAETIYKELSHIRKNLKHIIIIGIGGSSLGIKAIDGMLNHISNRNGIKLKFLEHTDPIEINEVLENVDIKSALFFVISKSGTTIETTSLLKYCINRFKLLENKERLIAITDRDSNLHKWAKDEGLRHFLLLDNVGGRFSILSQVGIVPLIFLGYDVAAILDGASQVEDDFFARNMDHILKKAIFYATNRHGYSMNIVFSYSSVLKYFNLWYVQLWGESLGKKNIYGNNIGLTPISLIGSIDQHSFAQLILQGFKDKTITFITLSQNAYSEPIIPDISLSHLGASDFVNNSSFANLLNKQQRATMEIFQDNEIPTDSIKISYLCEQSAGAMIMYFELLTSCVGNMLGINTYDQPAVELAKIRLKEIF